ncbi:MAG: hypothetical protein ABSC56_05250 [Solirubrobacteraceae bacterium]
MNPVESHSVSLRNSGASGEELLRVLWASRAPLETAAIARELGLHVNGVRRRLVRLRAQGLVERERVQGGVGRPRDQWRIAPRAFAEVARGDTGWLIASSLLEAISGGADLPAVESSGEQLGRELLARWGARVRAGPLMDRALEALGFTTERTVEDDMLHYRLTRCPYAALVQVNPAIVCTLHKGVARSLLAAAEPDAVLTSFEPGNPEVEGCWIRARLPGPGPPPVSPSRARG